MVRASTNGERVANRLVVSGSMRALLLLTAVLSVPPTASAVTLDEVVALSKSGVSDAVILALIDHRDRTIFSIAPDQILTLQGDGLSERSAAATG
jgi:hypothetical protein